MRGFDIWKRNEGYYSVYVDIYCDDLVSIDKDPANVFDSIWLKEFTTKDTSDPELFLGGDFERVK